MDLKVYSFEKWEINIEREIAFEVSILISLKTFIIPLIGYTHNAFSVFSVQK